MKILLALILAIALITVGFCIYGTHTKKHKLAQVVNKILKIGFIIILVNLIMLFLTRKESCSIGYTIYFIASDWLVYYLLQFSLTFIGRVFEKHVKKELMELLLWIDSIAIIVNNVTGHYFVLEEVEAYGEHFFELVTTPYFYIHFALILMIISFSLISLFYRTFFSADFIVKDI